MGQPARCSGGRGWRWQGSTRMRWGWGRVGWGGRPCFLDRTRDFFFLAFFFFFFFNFLATPCGMQDLSSLTKDRTCAPGSIRAKS